MSTLIHQRVEQARAGENPAVIARVASGWVVIGDTQFLRGYCLLLADPVVPSLNDLSEDQRQVFLRDMTVLGDALLELCAATRINYEILGNAEPALHAHLFPRYETESAERRRAPVWFYPKPRLPGFDAERDAALMSAIRESLRNRGVLIENP
ncbi:MAG: hypothetical protein AAGE65_08625 [Planctomycetota bacterium]